jgi:hypothetical protein
VLGEAIREERTIAEIARHYEVHPNLVTNWKRQLLESITDLFERSNVKRKDEKQEVLDDLFNQIGHLNDYGGLTELRRGVEDYFRFFNSERPHQSFEYRTPDEIYYEACGKIINKGA